MVQEKFKSSDKPEIVYRYRGFSPMIVDSLCDDTLHFADPTAFNDPLDCRSTVEPDSNRETLTQVLIELIIRGVEAETLASLQIAKLNRNKASAYAKNLGGLAARGELERVAYFAANPEYEGSVKETECGLLSNGIQRELLSSMITACVASRP